jgi:glycerophosphoryl diester phosphodiesterase
MGTLAIGFSLQAQTPMIVAHRGASRDAPENTIPAFELAWRQGADAIEGDFRLTQDGHIVCIHDKDTRRVANTNLVIQQSTLAEVRRVCVGGRHGEAFKNTVIPTLAEVLATVPAGKRIYIEIKCGTEIVPALLDGIATSRLTRDQIVLIAFNKEVLAKLKSAAPHYNVYWLCDFKKDAAGFPQPSLDTILKTLRDIKADGFSSGKDLVSEEMVRGVMEHGYEYHVWTVDDVATARRFKRWGAKSITTNIPGCIREGLAE